MSHPRRRELARHRQNRTYYVRDTPGRLVTKQIHPDGLEFLKRRGYTVGSIISNQDFRTLEVRHWLRTKDEFPYGGELNWAPEWHEIGRSGAKGKQQAQPHGRSHTQFNNNLKEAKQRGRASERKARGAAASRHPIPPGNSAIGESPHANPPTGRFWLYWTITLVILLLFAGMASHYI